MALLDVKKITKTRPTLGQFWEALETYSGRIPIRIAKGHTTGKDGSMNSKIDFGGTRDSTHPQTTFTNSVPLELTKAKKSDPRDVGARVHPPF